MFEVRGHSQILSADSMLVPRKLFCPSQIINFRVQLIFAQGAIKVS